MKKNTLKYFIFLIAITFISILLGYGTLSAATDQAQTETTKLTLADIGRRESELAAKGDVDTKYIIEETWRKRINEILAQLDKKKIKITKDVLEAVVASLGIDNKSPLTGQEWVGLMTGGRIIAMDPKAIEEYLDPTQYIQDVESETAPETKQESSSPYR